jgi:predicted RNA methylase
MRNLGICSATSKAIVKGMENFDPKQYKYLVTDPFQTINSIELEEFTILSDNSSMKDALRHPRSKFVYFGHYRNLLSLYEGLKRKLTKEISDSDISTRYLNVRRMRSNISKRLNTIYFTAGDSGIDCVQGAPQTQLLAKLTSRSNSNHVLVPIHTFLTGIKSMDQWNQRGIFIECIQQTIFPEYGVFNPTNQIYLNLFHQALKSHPHTRGSLLDIGTGTGILSIISSLSGFKQIDATDINPWAIECAQENFKILRLSNISTHLSDSFPSGNKKYDAIVFNPPWMSLEDEGTSTLDKAIFDQGHQFYDNVMKKAKNYMNGENARLYLIYSNLSQLFGIEKEEPNFHGLKCVQRLTMRKDVNRADPFYEIKKREEIQCFILKL